MAAAAASTRPLIPADDAGASLVVAAAAVVLAAVWSALAEAPWPAPVALFASLFARVALIALAAVLLWRAARRCHETSPWRRFYLSLTVGALSVLVGDLIYGAIVESSGQRPPYSAADLFWLAYFALLLHAVIGVPRVFTDRRDAVRYLLDAGILTTVTVALLVSLLHPPQVGGATTVVFVLSVIYPLGDLISILAAVLLITRLPTGGMRPAMWLLCLAMVASMAGDLTNSSGTGDAATAATQVWSDRCWNLWATALAACGYLAMRRSPSAIETDAAAAGHWRGVPYLALGAGYALLAAAGLGWVGAIGWMVTCGLVLTVLGIARMTLTESEQRRDLIREQSSASEQRFAALIAHSSDALLVLDGELRVVFASPAAERLLRATGRLDGQHLGEFLIPDDARSLADYARITSTGERTKTLMLRFTGEHGTLVTEATLTNLLALPQVRGIVLNVRDVSERTELEDQIRFQAFHDALTALPNRDLFFDRAERALARGAGGDHGVALAIIDLDNFKAINDSVGHLVADKALGQVASRLAGAVTGADSVARISGDQFGVVLEDAGDRADLMARLERLRTAIAAPLSIGGQSLRLTASIGAAIDFGRGSVDHLLRDADVALQRVKQDGGDSVDCYEQTRDAGESVRMSIEADLPRFLEDRRMRLMFAPGLALTDERPALIAASIDWVDPERAPAPIEAVMSASASAGFGGLLGAWAATEISRDYPALARYIPEVADMEVLLPMRSGMLREPALVERLVQLRERLGLPRGRLSITVSESALQRHRGATQATLRQASDWGLGLVLAGFGGGQGALDILDQVPFDTLMLSPRVLEGRIQAGRPHALLRVAVSTGTTLGLRVIATGVTEHDQLQVCRELGVMAAVGPLIAAPMSYERLLPWLGGRFAALKLGVPVRET